MNNDWGQGTYLTDDVWDASTNYAGEGPDLTNRIENTKEQIEDEIRDRVRYSEDLGDTLLDIQDEYGLDEHDMARVRGWADESGLISYRGGKFMPDHPDFMLNDESENLLASALTSRIARKQVKGANDGVIYPVRVKQDGLLNVKDEVEFPNYEAQAADELGYDYSKMDEYDEDVLFEIEERASDLQWEDYDSPNHNLFGVGNDLEADMSQVDSIYEGDTWNDVRNKMGGAAVETPDGDIVGSGGVVGQVMARGGATGVVDDFAPSRFPSMGAGHHTIMFPGSENQIRSVNAAFDPEYNGSNIMGGAAGTAGLAGLLAAGQSEDADAAVTLRLLKEAPEAYNSLRKQLARDRQKGLSPMRTAEKFIHDQSFTNYDKGFNQYARKVDGMSSGDYWKDGVQGLYDEIISAVDDPDPMVVEAMDSWLESHMGREAGSTMAQNRAKARAARAAGAGVGATAVAGGASADEGLPVPTGGDIMDSLFNVLGMPMAGLQGLARGAYGLATGEDVVTAGAEAANMMGARHDGLLMAPGGDTEEGWDRLGKKVEEETGDETLGFYAKWLPSLLSPF